MTQIKDVRFRKILDSRGNATVEADVRTTMGFGRGAAPSGASVGTHEVVSFPQGVDEALSRADGLGKELVGQDAAEQTGIDSLLRNSGVGGGVAIATSIAVAKAAANASGIPLYQYLSDQRQGERIMPRPVGNVIGGGKHAIGGPDIQEFLVISLGPTVAQSVFANAQVHHAIGKQLGKRLGTVGRGDEGAWVVPLSGEEVLDVAANVVAQVSDEVGFEIRLGLDMAASELFAHGAYQYRDKGRSKEQQIDYVCDLIDRYHLYYVEDPMHEDDFDGFAAITERVKGCHIVGDDLFTTNPERLKRGIEMGAGNAIIIKPNQIGTLTATIETIRLAQRHHYAPVISHRSGETTDNTIAHLAVAFGCPLIKTGVVGGERTAKLNELIRIEKEEREKEEREKGKKTC